MNKTNIVIDSCNLGRPEGALETQEGLDSLGPSLPSEVSGRWTWSTCFVWNHHHIGFKHSQCDGWVESQMDRKICTDGVIDRWNGGWTIRNSRE